VLLHPDADDHPSGGHRDRQQHSLLSIESALFSEKAYPSHRERFTVLSYRWLPI
jgi:hypothetical protein